MQSPNDMRPLESSGGISVADGRHCPICEKDIGIWPIVYAFTLSCIQCPHCFARLNYAVIRKIRCAYAILSVAVIIVVVHVSGMPAIVSGSLGATSVTEAGLECLCDLPSLRFVDLSSTTVSKSTQITDTAIEKLKRRRPGLYIAR